MVKDEVKSLFPKEISDFATPLIESTQIQAAPEHKELYDRLVKYYNVDKALFEAYGNTYSLKRDRADKDKDEDPSAGSNRGSKRRKSSIGNQDIEMPLNQGSKFGHANDQPDDEAASKQDWWKKPDKPPTPDRE
ncbi:hypothetical protein Tco_0013016 [Tanacetum coccineum]